SPLRESDPREDNPDLSYGYHKVQAEKVLQQAIQDQGFPATILRLPAVYGEFDYQIRERYFIKRLLDKRYQILLPDGGAGVNQREYAGNIAAQLCFLLENPKSIGQVYNSGHAKVQTYRSLVEDAMEIMGHQATLYTVASQLFPAIPDLAAPGVHLQSTAKLESLGWQEVYSLREGLARTIAWLRQEPDEILPTHRNKDKHFDYALEDEIISTHGLKISQS
ncbi:MAG: NAD-dependent epimerase/dehydratase family protein, partial [Symbiobacteriaceae bacterium]|nr:NAD-dependent epimerase/dehydratase family protein [Symbiobacteriaceae bacterium]